jgi:hypothetical protein
LKKNYLKKRLILGASVFFLSFAGHFVITNQLWYPKGSIKLHQKMVFDEYEDFSKLFVENYQLSKEEYEELQKGINRPNEIGEYTIFKQNDKWFIVSKTPDGNNKIRNIRVLDSNEISILEEFID